MTVTFQKARQKWCYSFFRAGERHRGYCLDHNGKDCTTKRAAKEAEGVEKRRVAEAPEAPKVQASKGYTLGQAIVALSTVWKKQASWSNRKRYLHEIKEFFGEQKPMADFDAEAVREYIDYSITRPIMKWAGGTKRDSAAPENARFWKTMKQQRGNNTTNLYLGVLRQLLAHAGKVKDGRGLPVLREVPEVTQFVIGKRKPRPVPHATLENALATVPQHVVEAIKLTLIFGGRKDEVFTLTPAHVDHDARGIRLRAEDVKDDEDAFIPVNAKGMEFLDALIAQAKQRGVKTLISYRPYRKDPKAQAAVKWRPIKSPKRAWGTAMKRIEAEGGRRYRWHDLRAYFITKVAIESGGATAQRFARHSDPATTAKYVHVADEFMRLAAERVGENPLLQVKRAPALRVVK